MADWTIINGKEVYGNNGSSYWRTLLVWNVDNSYSATKSKITFSYGLHLSKELHSDHTYTKGYDTTYVTCTGQTKKTYSPSGTLSRGNSDKGDDICYGNGSFIIDKKTSKQTVTLSAYINHPKTYSGYIGKSTASKSIDISALASYTTSFNANGGSGAPSAVTHYYGKTFTVPTTKPTKSGFAFSHWNTNASGTGSKYYSGSSYTYNGNLTLYAIWTVTSPPTVEVTNKSCQTPTADPLEPVITTNSIIRGFSSLSVTATLTPFTGRTISRAQLHVGDMVSNVVSGGGSQTFTLSADVLRDAPLGSNNMYIVATDNLGATSTVQLGSVGVIAPSWTAEVVIEKDKDDLPRVTQNNDVVVDEFLVWNYETSQYDSMSTSGLQFVDKGDSEWGFVGIFDEKHVYPSTSVDPQIKVMVYYRHFTEDVSDVRRAFFTTTRNQNYTNGIYNMMFVSGCDNVLYPDYNSRVWWCSVNDPLYFPDLNYTEVGSNDTSVQGLTKVGDYLGVVKQSKTTDTAIFLLYPTSFEEITTFAVKQGVQGVGALARYSFNVLGDETLFLSPNGVMAITPSDDNEHKVKNRSYYVDKKLLAESEVESSYSFVHDGKYYLSIGDGKGSVYVLDGNQRNSWGNDRTNLVYECYYLENVPAKCFVKFQDKLVFATLSEICVVADGYQDAYDNLTGEENVPVKAEWSTILDDDNALHYYKTMQKKGNLVSILPMDVFYAQVSITEETFNANKTIYYTHDEETGEYIQCTPDSLFDSEEIYYVQHKSETKVYVRKDSKEPVEIERAFGVSSDIPSEMHLNKKFKKYKRLQFIIKNEVAEPFGLDSIIKNYTIGSYSKK